MENERKEAQEKIEEMKKGERVVVSVTPGRLRQDELKAQLMTPTT
jgi:hypothetical protein